MKNRSAITSTSSPSRPARLVIRGLAARRLRAHAGRIAPPAIRISSGIENDGLLISSTRILPRHSPPIPTIANASAANNELSIQLRDHGPDTRVSLIGRRYQHDEWNPRDRGSIRLLRRCLKSSCPASSAVVSSPTAASAMKCATSSTAAPPKHFPAPSCRGPDSC